MPQFPEVAARRFAAAAAIAILGLAPNAAAQDEASRLAESLIRMRGEVEQTNGELELAREEQRTTLQGLAAQKAELEAQLERQQLQLAELEGRLAAKHADSLEAADAGSALPPVLLDAIAGLRAHIARALPFKTDERLAALDEIRMLIENGTLPPTRAANRLWAYLEDELRLTHETGLHQQTVVLGRERVLAQVAKVGTVMLFFRTEDGRVGRAVPAANTWRFETIADEAGRAQVLALFDALDKQIRQGYFELPFAGAAGG